MIGAAQLEEQVYDAESLAKAKEDIKLRKLQQEANEKKVAKLEVAFELLKHRTLTVDEALAMAEELAEKIGL